MKYKSEKTLRRAKKAFSLIELMIVIVIIGALTAIILPQFDVSEAEAKDTGCDASNYGTLSQLSKFRSINGVYPARMHTGLETNASDAAIMGAGTTENNAAIPSFTFYNMRDNTSTVALEKADTGTGTLNNDAVDLATSFKEAGMVSLAYGGFPVDKSKAYEEASFVATAATASGNEAYVMSIGNYNWYENWLDANGDGIIQTTEEGTLVSDDTTGGITATSTGYSPISINGVPLKYYAFSDAQVAYANDTVVTGTETGTLSSSAGTALTVTYSEDGVVVPLFIAPTTDWEHWYDADGIQSDSKVSVAQVGQCPWLEGGVEFRYYIAIFKAYYDGRKAKLIGTMCPEGGSLNP